MLRVLGATQITLRIPDASSGDTGGQLGLTPPTSSDVQIAPALLEALPPEKDGTQSVVVTVSARALQPIAEAYGVEDIGVWLLTSQGIVQGDQLLKITSLHIDQLAGLEYLYHIVAAG